MKIAYTIICSRTRIFFFFFFEKIDLIWNRAYKVSFTSILNWTRYQHRVSQGSRRPVLQRTRSYTLSRFERCGKPIFSPFFLSFFFFLLPRLCVRPRFTRSIESEPGSCFHILRIQKENFLLPDRYNSCEQLKNPSSVSESSSYVLYNLTTMNYQRVVFFFFLSGNKFLRQQSIEEYLYAVFHFLNSFESRDIGSDFSILHPLLIVKKKIFSFPLISKNSN